MQDRKRQDMHDSNRSGKIKDIIIILFIMPLAILHILFFVRGLAKVCLLRDDSDESRRGSLIALSGNFQELYLILYD